MKPSNLIILLIISIIIPPMTASADIYHWQDEKGVDHYTNDSPPPGAKILLAEPDFVEKPDEKGSERRIEEVESAYLEKQEALAAELAETKKALQETVDSSERSIEELREKLTESDRKAEIAEIRMEDLQRESARVEDPESRVEAYVERDYIPFFLNDDKDFGKRSFKRHRDRKNPKSFRDGERSDRKRRFDDDSPSSLQEKSRLRHASGIHTDRRLF